MQIILLFFNINYYFASTSVLKEKVHFINVLVNFIGPRGRVICGVGMRQLACWDCGFEIHRIYGCLSVASVVCIVR
jgi:predicted Kef-type K+ transport protein